MFLGTNRYFLSFKKIKTAFFPVNYKKKMILLKMLMYLIQNSNEYSFIVIKHCAVAKDNNNP